jgi:hypothetical protein
MGRTTNKAPGPAPIEIDFEKVKAAAATNNSMKAVCQAIGLSYDTLFNLPERFQQFKQSFEEGRNIRAVQLGQDIMDVARHKIEVAKDKDNKPIMLLQNPRLAMDVMRKLAPAEWGDKQEVTHAGEVTVNQGESKFDPETRERVCKEYLKSRGYEINED